MNSRITLANVSPGKLDELIAMQRDTSYPAYSKLHGFKGAIFLVDREKNSAASITLWETKDDLDAFDAKTRELFGSRFDELLTDRDIRHDEVAVQM